MVNYYWTECPSCRCQIAVNTSVSGGTATGSLRRWSTDRGINDGRAIRGVVLSADVGFETECVCGRRLLFAAEADAVGSERG